MRDEKFPYVLMLLMGLGVTSLAIRDVFDRGLASIDLLEYLVWSFLGVGWIVVGLLELCKRVSRSS